LFALSAIVAWVFVPFGKFLQFLATGTELTRNRSQAVGLTLFTFCLIIIGIGLIRLPDYWRVEGVVEPVNLAIVHTESDGFVAGYLPSESKVSSGGTPLIRAVNPELEAEKKSSVAERRSLEIKRRIAETQEFAAAQILDEQIEALNEKITRLEDELESLNLKPPLSGTWVAPDIEYSKGSYLERGKSIGFVASLDDVIIRATAGQNVAAMIIDQAGVGTKVEFRVKGQPKLLIRGTIDKISESGQEVLPSEALGYAVGGSMPTSPQDPQGTKSAERFYEVRIKPEAGSPVRLLTGQRVVTRIPMHPKPLALQWWLSARQLFQRRFHI
jgi:putative peptide zinc metalloprotease protein